MFPMGRANQRIPRSEGPNTKGESKWQVAAKVAEVVAAKAAVAETVVVEKEVVVAVAEKVVPAPAETTQVLLAIHLVVAEVTGRVERGRRQWWPGPTRKVPGRNGMSWEEEDWIDEQETAHRGDDE